MKLTDCRHGLVSASTLMVITLTAASTAAPAFARERWLTLRDFDVVVGPARSVPSIKTTVPCRRDIVEFKHEDGNLCLVSVTLTPKKAGELSLVPELFVAFAENVHFLRRCDGVRVVSPEPEYPVPEVFAPSTPSRDWPGRATRVTVTAGQPVTIELAFQLKKATGVRVFAAVPIGKVPDSKRGGDQQKSTTESSLQNDARGSGPFRS